MNRTHTRPIKRIHSAAIGGIAISLIAAILIAPTNRGSESLTIVLPRKNESLKDQVYAADTSDSSLPGASSALAEKRTLIDAATQTPRLSPEQARSLLSEVYEDLLPDLHLTREASDQFLDLVSIDWRPSQTRADQDAILELLGYAGFQRYEVYSSTLEERSIVRGLEQELEVSGLAQLGDQRKASLLSMLLEEHSAIPPAKSAPLSERDRQDRINQLERFDERVLQRAEFILSEEQWAIFRARVERSNEQRKR